MMSPEEPMQPWFVGTNEPGTVTSTQQQLSDFARRVIAAARAAQVKQILHDRDSGD